MKYSQKINRHLAAALFVLCIALCCTACGGSDSKPTPRPQNTAPVHDNFTAPTATDVGTPEQPTESPTETGAPDSEKPTAAADDGIPDFQAGKVIKPEDVPEIRSAIEKEYPGYTIQSVTHEMLSDRQTYKITLQGSGEAAKVVYMLADGTIVVPKTQD